MLGYASVQKQGHSALYRSLHSTPVDVGRTEGTHRERENAADREVVGFGKLKGAKEVLFPEEEGILRS